MKRRYKGSVVGSGIGITGLFFGLWIVCFTVFIPSELRAAEVRPRVLVIHSYEPDYEAYRQYDKLIEKELSERRLKAGIRTVHLDCEQYRGKIAWRRMAGLLDSAAAWQPDLILVNDDPAVCALLHCDHPLVYRVPVVFAGVNFPDWELLKRFPNVTGLWDKPEYLKTIRMIERMYGRTRIHVLTDDTPWGGEVSRSIAEELEPAPNIYIQGKAYEVHNNFVGKPKYQSMLLRPEYSTVYFVNLRTFTGASLLWRLSGRSRYSVFLQTKRDFATARWGNHASIPTYSVVNEGFGVGEGILGGYLTTLQTQIEQSAVIVSDLLLGKKQVGDIPVRTTPKDYVLDWTAMKRWHIDPGHLPEGYRIINMPFYVRYKALVISISVILGVGIVALIGYLLFLYFRENRKKRLAQQNLRKEKESLAESVRILRERERELIAARELAEKAELKQSFLANMSHEIRTPLNAIVGFSNLIASDAELSVEDRQEFVDTIDRNSELLLNLINDILDLSRIESGNMSFAWEICDMATLIDEIYLTHRLLIPERLRFEKETDPTPARVRVDKFRFTQVVTNLLSNAAKFTETGYIKLGYRCLPSGGGVAVFVEDTGKGIPAEEQRMIFNRFYKRDEFAQGTGLGLSICEVIVRKLGGRVELVSEPGKGSRFTIVLPCVADGEPDTVDIP